MAEITLNYELTAEDCSNFGKENSSAQAGYQPMLITLVMMYLLFIFSDVIYAALFGGLNGFEPMQLLISVIARFFLTLILVMFSLAVIKWIINRREKQVSEMGKNALICEHQLILTEDELIEVTDFYINRSAWKVIGELKESENFLYFGSATAFTYIIPKRYFEDHLQIKNFTDTFQTYRQKSLDEYTPSYYAALDTEPAMKVKEMN